MTEEQKTQLMTLLDPKRIVSNDLAGGTIKTRIVTTPTPEAFARIVQFVDSLLAVVEGERDRQYDQNIEQVVKIAQLEDRIRQLESERRSDDGELADWEWLRATVQADLLDSFDFCVDVRGAWAPLPKTRGDVRAFCRLMGVAMKEEPIQAAKATPAEPDAPPLMRWLCRACGWQGLSREIHAAGANGLVCPGCGKVGEVRPLVTL